MNKELEKLILEAAKKAASIGDANMAIILYCILGSYNEDGGEKLRPIAVNYAKQARERCLENIGIDFSSYEQTPRENL